MRTLKLFYLKRFMMVGLLLLPLAWCFANEQYLKDGHSNIPIKESRVQGSPRTTSIQASIDGHTLSVVFLENLGQVNVAIMAVGGSEAQSESTPTPNGVDFYIPFTGNYIVYFTLPNGDTYYGEFEVTD